MRGTLKGKEFASLGANSKGANSFFKSRPYLRKEAIRNLQKLFLLVRMVEGGQVHINQLYTSKMLASTKY